MYVTHMQVHVYSCEFRFPSCCIPWNWSYRYLVVSHLMLVLDLKTQALWNKYVLLVPEPPFIPYCFLLLMFQGGSADVRQACYPLCTRPHSADGILCVRVPTWLTLAAALFGFWCWLDRMEHTLKSLAVF